MNYSTCKGCTLSTWEVYTDICDKSMHSAKTMDIAKYWQRVYLKLLWLWNFLALDRLQVSTKVFVQLLEILSEVALGFLHWDVKKYIPFDARKFECIWPVVLHEAVPEVSKGQVYKSEEKSAYRNCVLNDSITWRFHYWFYYLTILLLDSPFLCSAMSFVPYIRSFST